MMMNKQIFVTHEILVLEILKISIDQFNYFIQINSQIELKYTTIF